MNETLQDSFVRVIESQAFQEWLPGHMNPGTFALHEDWAKVETMVHSEKAAHNVNRAIRVIKTLVQRFRYNLRWYV